MNNLGASEGFGRAFQPPSSGERSLAAPLPFEAVKPGERPKVTVRLTRWPVLGMITEACRTCGDQFVFLLLKAGAPTLGQKGREILDSFPPPFALEFIAVLP